MALRPPGSGRLFVTASQGDSHGPAIHARNVRKVYRVYHGQGRGWLQSVLVPFGRQRFYTDSEALSGIELEVPHGEVLGILGRNGSGKSTLLRLLAGISTPTSGTIEVNGSVRCLLSTGISFDPRFTGRQNILFGSAAMGISSRAAKARMDEIIDFSELEADIDKPTMFYSDGMRTRLAFAVAFQETPEILLLDEALNAGDMFFQTKCEQRIRDIVSSGSTVLMATHSLEAVEQLCLRAMILDGGKIEAIGPAGTVAERYREMLVEDEARRPEALAKRGFAPKQPAADATPTTEREAGIELIDASMWSGDAKRTDTLHHGEPFELRLRLRGVGDLPVLRITLELFSEDFGLRVASTGTEHLSVETGDLASFPIRHLHGDHELVVRVPRNPLGSGAYSWAVSVRPFDADISTEDYLRRQRVAPFRSVSFPGHPLGSLRRALIEPEVQLRLEALEPAPDA